MGRVPVRLLIIIILPRIPSGDAQVPVSSPGLFQASEYLYAAMKVSLTPWKGTVARKPSPPLELIDAGEAELSRPGVNYSHQIQLRLL